MEQNIKNFDRGIEQKMNEHEVAPPFGMWNRISAELEAMPVAAATTAPVVTSLIPKRAMVGIIAAALVMGTAILTGYMVNSSLYNDKVNTTIGVSAKTVHESSVTQTQPVKADVVSPAQVAKPMAKHRVAGNPVEATLQAAQQIKPAFNEPVAVSNPAPASPGATNNSLITSNANTDVPTPIEPIAQSAETQTYYFPPIDVNTPEKTKTESTFNVKKSTVTTASADESSYGPPRERKFHPLLHRKKKFSYGNIIR